MRQHYVIRYVFFIFLHAHHDNMTIITCGQDANVKFVMDALDMGWTIRKRENEYEIWGEDNKIKIPELEGVTNVTSLTFDVDTPKNVTFSKL